MLLTHVDQEVSVTPTLGSFEWYRGVELDHAGIYPAESGAYGSRTRISALRRQRLSVKRRPRIAGEISDQSLLLATIGKG